MSDIQNAIGRLYEAFSVIPAPTQIEACACCHTNGQVESLVCGQPAARLAPDVLTDYAADVFLTAGDQADYLFFLPRILELHVEDPYWGHDPELTGRAIHASNPASWSEAQRSAVAHFFHTAVRSMLDAKNYDELDSWICAIGRSGFPVLPALNQLLDDQAALEWFVEANPNDPQVRRLRNAYWESSDPGFHAVVEWLQSPAVRERLVK